MELGAVKMVGFVQGSLSDLIIFLASISVAVWLLVLVSIVLRFGASVRYRRRAKRRTMREAHEL